MSLQSNAPRGGISTPPSYVHSPDARDAYIAGRLVTAYALSDQLSPFDLKVDVRDGQVTLSGIVDDKVLRDLAGDIAREIEGVESVRCDVVIESPAPRGRGLTPFARRIQDASLAAQVKSRLRWNGDTHGQPIDVQCRDGIIDLTGEARSALARECAERLAREIRDVLDVRNEIVVR